ncbi:phage tail tube protein [Elizabethkingia miricola]
MGKDIILYVHDGTAYRPVACLTSNGLNVTQEMRDLPVTKCSPDKKKAKGALSYEIPFEGQFIDTTSVGGSTAKASYDFLLKHIKEAKDTEALTFWKQTTSNGATVVDTSYGKGSITSLQLTAPAEGEATFQGTLQGEGWVSKTDLIKPAP